MSISQEYKIDDLPDELLEKASRIPLSALHLPSRAETVLEKSGHKSSLDGIRFLSEDLKNLPGIGEKTLKETEKAIYSFIKRLQQATPAELAKLEDPRELFFKSAVGNLVSAFPGIVTIFFEKNRRKSGARDLDVVNKRFGLTDGKHYTLEDIGTYYDLTRERVRQIEERAIKDIDALLCNQLRTKDWRIDSALCESYKRIKRQLESSSNLVFAEEVDLLLTNEFESRLPKGYRDFFMEVAGFIKLPQSFERFRGAIKTCWCLACRYNRREIESVFQALDVIFDAPATSLTLFDLTVKAKKKAKKKISNESIAIALKACNEIEVVADAARVKFVCLKSAADKAFRILEAAAVPMHYSAIAREVNLLQKDSTKFRALKDINIKNQLVSDDRFVPIGRSGEWGLSQWSDLNTKTIVETICDILHRSGNPMTFDDIVSSVQELRPDASIKSIIVYLSQEERFSRVGNSEYALASWKLPPAESRSRKTGVGEEEFRSAVSTSLAQSAEMPFPELIRRIRKETDLSEASVRQRLLKAPYLDVRSAEGKQYKTAYVVGPIEDTIEGVTTKVLLRDKVQGEIRSILCEHPNVPYKKGLLYKEVTGSVKCLKPTFYRYLEEMEDVRQYKEGNNYYAVYDNYESVARIEIDLDGYEIDEILRGELNRPLSKLTVEEVDIGLFELGLFFENKLKDYLLEAKKTNMFNLVAKDSGRLSDMISCTVREGIVTKGHHLTTLREERNKRAHGNVPTLEERKSLFNKAHYVADLFVKYIVFFHNERLKLTKNLTSA